MHRAVSTAATSSPPLRPPHRVRAAAAVRRRVTAAPKPRCHARAGLHDSIEVRIWRVRRPAHAITPSGCSSFAHGSIGVSAQRLPVKGTHSHRHDRASTATPITRICAPHGLCRHTPFVTHNESSLQLLSSGCLGFSLAVVVSGASSGSHGGLPRGRVWPSARRTSRSFVLASLRALHLDLRLRRRLSGSDRGMPSPVPGAVCGPYGGRRSGSG